MRDVVRLDPDRSLTQGLRDQLAAWSTRQLYLVVASAPPLAILRDETRRVERPPVRRPLSDRRDGPAPVAADDRPDLTPLVRAAVDGGAATLAEVTTQVLPLYREAERFAAAGRVAALVAARSRIDHPRGRAWVDVGHGLEIEPGSCGVVKCWLEARQHRSSTWPGERTTLCGSRPVPMWPYALAHKAEARP